MGVAFVGLFARRVQGALQVLGVGQFTHQLFDSDVGVFYQRLHGVDVFQRRVQVHGIVDAEHGFADFVAAAGAAADHLFVKNARLNPPQKYQVADAGYIDAGGKQVHGDGDVGVAFVFVP